MKFTTTLANWHISMERLPKQPRIQRYWVLPKNVLAQTKRTLYRRIRAVVKTQSSMIRHVE